MPAAAALLALALAAVAGADRIALAVALALWGVAWLARGLRRLLALLAAPVALVATLPAPTVVSTPALLALVAAALALAPFVRELGPGFPGRRTAAIAGGAIALAVAAVATPQGAALAASDLAAGASTLLLFAGVLVAATVARPRA